LSVRTQALTRRRAEDRGMREFLKAICWLAAVTFGLPGLCLLLWTFLSADGPTGEFALFYGIFLVVEFIAAALLVVVLSAIRMWSAPPRAFISIGAVYLASLFTPLVDTMARYPLYVVECGGAPVVVTDFAAAYTYRVLGDEGYSVTPLDTGFFCTPQEAEHLRYRHSPV
jgi:hypothetical protein